MTAVLVVLLSRFLICGAVAVLVGAFVLCVYGAGRWKHVGLILLLTVNLLGVACLIYFAVPYLTHNTILPNPGAMLPAERWDDAGMCLTIGVLPLMAVNLLGFLGLKGSAALPVRLLLFVPGLVCVGLTVSYWIISLL